MTNEKTIERVVKEAIAKELIIDVSDITRETDLVNDLNADSMDIVNIVTTVESRFKIAFPDESKMAYNSYTVQFLIDGVKDALMEANRHA